MEVPAPPTGKQKTPVVLHLIAEDAQGRKFTNCSSLDLSFLLQGQHTFSQEYGDNDWIQIQRQIQHPSNERPMRLRHHFDLERH